MNAHKNRLVLLSVLLLLLLLQRSNIFLTLTCSLTVLVKLVVCTRSCLESQSFSASVAPPLGTKAVSVLPCIWGRTAQNMHALEFVGLSHMGSSGDTLRASLSGIFLQTLPEYVAPMKGHSLSLTISEILKRLSSLPALMQKSFWWRQCNDRYIISLSPHLHTPFPPSPTFSPSLISLTVSVDVKHNVYLLQVHLHTPSPLLLPVPNKPYGFCGR